MNPRTIQRGLSRHRPVHNLVDRATAVALLVFAAMLACTSLAAATPTSPPSSPPEPKPGADTSKPAETGASAQSPGRIVLSWDRPADNDLWVTDPQGNVSNYTKKSIPGGRLDVDDTSRVGPETFTVAPGANGTFTIRVQCYAGCVGSTASVTVYVGSAPARSLGQHKFTQTKEFWNVGSATFGSVCEPAADWKAGAGMDGKKLLVTLYPASGTSQPGQLVATFTGDRFTTNNGYSGFWQTSGTDKRRTVITGGPGVNAAAGSCFHYDWTAIPNANKFDGTNTIYRNNAAAEKARLTVEPYLECGAGKSLTPEEGKQLAAEARKLGATEKQAAAISADPCAYLDKGLLGALTGSWELEGSSGAKANGKCATDKSGKKLYKGCLPPPTAQPTKYVVQWNFVSDVDLPNREVLLPGLLRDDRIKKATG